MTASPAASRAARADGAPKDAQAGGAPKDAQADGATKDSQAGDDSKDTRPLLVRSASIVWRLITATVGACFRYRVTGLAAEAAFFAILSLPPLIFGLAGTIGYVADRYQVTTVETIRLQVLNLFGRALTPDTVDQVIRPTLNDVLAGGRADVISLGFVLALWSGSRALNVLIDTISIMYGLGGRRGIVKTRALSFSLYVIALLIGIVVLPLVVAGPELVDRALPARLDLLNGLYWPIVLALTIAFLATLYHLSVPVRTSWRYDLPGATFTLLTWLGGSAVLRWSLQEVIGGTSIYGPLAAPIAVLIWLYVLSITVLIGAALNAAFDRVFPANTTSRARLELVRRLRTKAAEVRMREGGLSEAEIAGEPVDTLALQALAGGPEPGRSGRAVSEELDESADRVLQDVRRQRRG